MSLFIFLTTEGYTFQPNSESAEPDIENCQVLGFASGADAKEAFLNLLSENEYLKETTFDETFAMELANEEKRWFRLKSA